RIGSRTLGGRRRRPILLLISAPRGPSDSSWPCLKFSRLPNGQATAADSRSRNVVRTQKSQPVQGRGLARPLLIRARMPVPSRRQNDGACRHVYVRQSLRSATPARPVGLYLRTTCQPGRARRRAATTAMYAGREPERRAAL